MNDELDDSQLEQELRLLAARFEPVPPELMTAAVDAFEWRDIDTQLADLVYDSLLDTDQAALVRGTRDQRLFSFQAQHVTIDLEVTHTGQGRSLMGQVIPPQPGLVELRQQHSVVTVSADELGRFRSEPLPPGPLSLRLHAPAGTNAPTVTTAWVSI
jgi:hypothetical protein